MPPKRRKASATAESISEEDLPGGKASKTANKKPKVTKDPVKPLDSTLPTNRGFPSTLNFTSREEGTIRLTTWNVCGINASDKKGLRSYVEAEDADVVILTETKVQSEPDLLYLKTRYKYRYWGADPQKGYAGVAVLSKVEPLKVTYGLPTLEPQLESAGRFVMLEYQDFYVIGAYTPNAGEKLKNMDKKVKWNIAFEEYLKQLDSLKPVVWAGDINCAHTEKDIRNAKTNWNKTPGYTQLECEALSRQLNPAEGKGEKKLDAWREKHPNTVGHYTYYSYKFQCREKGIGWRLDTFIVSQRLWPQVSACEIRHECYGASDHLPVILELKGFLK